MTISSLIITDRGSRNGTRKLSILLCLPAGYSLDWGGDFENSQRSLKAAFGDLPLALLLTLVFVPVLYLSLAE